MYDILRLREDVRTTLPSKFSLPDIVPIISRDNYSYACTISAATRDAACAVGFAVVSGEESVGVDWADGHSPAPIRGGDIVYAPASNKYTVFDGSRLITIPPGHTAMLRAVLVEQKLEPSGELNDTNPPTSVQPDGDKYMRGTWYHSAITGELYETAAAAHVVDMVHVDGKVYLLDED